MKNKHIILPKKVKEMIKLLLFVSVWFVSELRYVFTTNSIPVMGI